MWYRGYRYRNVPLIKMLPSFDVHCMKGGLQNISTMEFLMRYAEMEASILNLPHLL